MANLTVTPQPDQRVIEICPNTLILAGMLAGILFKDVLGPLGPLLFLMLGALVLVRRPMQSMSGIARSWYMFLLPAFALLSTVWSVYPGESLKSAIQYILTFVFVVAVTRLVSAKNYLLVVFILYCAVALWSILFGNVRGDTGAWTGIYFSKNYFAANMLVFFISALALALAEGTSRIVRLAAIIALPVAVVLLLLADSTGGLLVAGPAALVILTGLLLRFFTGIQRVVFLVLMALVAIGLGILIAAFWDFLFEQLLIYSGKDVTLTGRTFIWDIGFRLIAENPIIGVGFQAFWVQGNTYAEIIWANFGIVERAGFHFHNMYIHHTVELGIIGLALNLFLLFGAIFLTIVWAIQNPSAESVFFLGLQMAVLIYSMVEVPVYFQFNTNSIILISSFVLAAREVRRARERPVFTRSRRAPAAAE